MADNNDTNDTEQEMIDANRLFILVQDEKGEVKPAPLVPLMNDLFKHVFKLEERLEKLEKGDEKRILTLN